MRRPVRFAAVLACLVAALVLHETFCEWRTLRVPAEQGDGAHARLLLRIREVAHPSGNAADWDRADAELRAYDRDWLACHREVRGDPEPDAPLAVCLSLRPYTIVGATAEAVARGECELELHGSLPDGAAIAACLAARGRRDSPIPRWGYERLGPRFTGPWLALTGLFAERDVANVVVPTEIAVAAGIALPAVLGAAAVRLGLGLRVSGARSA
jgi:hypothetical protein